jgi:hypothetical protein
MILYHFTDWYFLEAGGTILKEGLKPAAEIDDLPPHGVVWLTTEEDYRWAEGKSRELDQQCRIRLAIPSHDRRLVHWPKWLRKHAPDVIEMLAVGSYPAGYDYRIPLSTTYCYFGTVPLTYFRVVEPADPEARARADIVEVRAVA